MVKGLAAGKVFMMCGVVVRGWGQFFGWRTTERYQQCNPTILAFFFFFAREQNNGSYVSPLYLASLLLSTPHLKIALFFFFNVHGGSKVQRYLAVPPELNN